MKKVLIVNDEKMMGGVNILLEDYLNNMDLNDILVDILVLHDNGDRLKNIPENINFVKIGNEFSVVDKSLKELLKEKKFISAFKKACFGLMIKNGTIKKYILKYRNKYNIKDYDVEIAFKDGFCTLFTSYGNSKTKITWLHNDYSRNNFILKYKETFDNAFKNIDKIIAISNDIKENFIKFYGNEEKIKVINNYIDENKIKTLSEQKNELILDDSKINIVSVGRLSYEKGYDRLIEAVNRLKNENLAKNICINIIGDGQYRDKLESKIKEYQLENTVVLLGKKINPYSFMKNYDLSIICSRYEAYCLVMIESLILKIPLMTTKVASVEQILNNEEYGFVVENSEDGIYCGLKKILENKNIISKYKENLKKYSYNEMNERIMHEFNLTVRGE